MEGKVMTALMLLVYYFYITFILIKKLHEWQFCYRFVIWFKNIIVENELFLILTHRHKLVK